MDYNQWKPFTKQGTWANIMGDELISAKHVLKAISEKKYRSSLYEEKIQNRIHEGGKSGQFHIYQVQTIEEGIEILTGTPAGQPKEQD